MEKTDDFKCFHCHEWKDISDMRFKYNIDNDSYASLDMLFEQLQTEDWLSVIAHAVKVEDAVKKMKGARKVLEKQRIEINFGEK